MMDIDNSHAPQTPSSPTTEPDHAAQRLARAKDNYHSQSHLLTAADRQHRAVLEYGMEKVTANLPSDLKAEAQANFYENQIRQTANLMEVPDVFRQPETTAAPPSVVTASTEASANNQPDRPEPEFDR